MRGMGRTEDLRKLPTNCIVIQHTSPYPVGIRGNLKYLLLYSLLSIVSFQHRVYCLLMQKLGRKNIFPFLSFCYLLVSVSKVKWGLMLDWNARWRACELGKTFYRTIILSSRKVSLSLAAATAKVRQSKSYWSSNLRSRRYIKICDICYGWK